MRSPPQPASTHTSSRSKWRALRSPRRKCLWLSGCQVVRLSGCQVVRLSGCRVGVTGQLDNLTTRQPVFNTHMRSIVAAASLLLLVAATAVDPLRAFLSSLTPSARKKALFTFSDEERFD